MILSLCMILVRGGLLVLACFWNPAAASGVTPLQTSRTPIVMGGHTRESTLVLFGWRPP
jgi:hypothetical protein